MRSLQVSTPLLVLLAMITGLDALAIDLHLPASGMMAATLQVNEPRMALALTAFVAGMGLGQVLWAPILDAKGRRLPTLVGVALFTLAAGFCAMAPRFELLVAGRLLQGLAAGVAVTVPRIIIADLCDGQAKARAYSTLMQVFLMVPVLAPLLGAALLDPIGWRGLFWLLAGAGLLMLVWSMLALPETLPPAGRRPLAAGRFLLGLARLLAGRRIAALLMIGALVSGVLFAYLGSLPAAVSHDFGFSPGAVSLVFAVNAIGMILAGEVNKFLLRRWPVATILQAALVMILIGGLATATAALLLPAGLWPLVMALLFLPVAALSLAFPNLAAVTMDAAGQERGTGSALFGVAQNLGGAAVGMSTLAFGGGMAGLGLAMASFGGLAGLIWLVLSRSESRRPSQV